MTDVALEVECSTLCRYVTEDKITLRTAIFRLKRSGEPWSLEVADEQDTTTAWDDTFPTEQDALTEFHAAMRKEGIRSFVI